MPMNNLQAVLNIVPLHPPLLTLVVLGLALLLLPAIHALVTLLLRRGAPSWVDGVSLLLQLGLLIGAGVLIVRYIDPGVVVVWPALLGLTLLAAACVPGNLISDGIAFLRIRGLHHCRVGDWVRLAGGQTGSVMTIGLLSTLVQAPTGELVRMGNSRVLGKAIVLRNSPAGSVAPAGLSDVEAGSGQAGVGPGQARPLPPLGKRPPLGARSILSFARK